MKALKRMTAMMAAGVLLLVGNIGILPKSVTEKLAIEVSAAGTIVASGECGAQGDNLTWTLDDEGTLTISGRGKMADFELETDVPWYSYSSIATVIIDNGITSIEDFAFIHQRSITSIRIPGSVVSIGDCAFWACDSLTSIAIPDSVTNIGDSAFTTCDSLTSINVDSENKYYASEDGVLFSKDKSILIQYPGGKTMEEYDISDSVTCIGDWAFYACDRLISIAIPDSVTSIGDWAFGCCRNLKAINVDIENKYFASEEGVLFNKDKAILIRYPEGKDSGEYITLNSVTSIGDDAFEYCSGLNSITIPDSVTSIGYEAFKYCDSLVDVYYSGAEEEWNAITINSGNECLTDATIHYNALTCESEMMGSGICGAQGDNLTWTLDSEGTLTINGEGEMIDCGYHKSYWYSYDSIRNVVIDSGVTSIGGYAFDSCINLTSIEIPNGVTNIGYGAFFCSGLTNITIPNSVTSIGYTAFSYCSDLTDVYYTGTEEDWNSITIESGNERLYDSDVKIHYNSKLPDSEKQSEYQFFNMPLTWSKAKEYCESLNGHLAVITSVDEQMYIDEQIPNIPKNCYWIGAYLENDEWKWITDEPFEYNNWGINMPDNNHGVENYAHMYGKDWFGGAGNKYRGEWNDASDAGAGYANGFYDQDNFGFICEWEDGDREFTDIIDFDVMQVAEFIAKNPNYYEICEKNDSVTKSKKAAMTDPGVTDYLWWKEILGQNDNDYNAELAIEAIVAELVVSDEVVEGIEAAAERAAERAMNDTLLMFAESTELFGIEGDEMEVLLDLVKAIEGGAVGAEFAAERSAWLSNFFKYADLTTLTAQLEVMSKNIELVGILYKAVIGVATAPEEVYNLYIASYAYHAANESFQDSLKLFNDYVQAEAAAYTGEDDYSQRVRYVAQQFENCYQRLIDTSDEKYTHYFEVVCSDAFGNAVMDLTYEATTQLIIGCVTLACPQLGAALETLKLTLEIGMNVWEALSEVDERALERDMFLNMLIFSDAIGKAMNDTEKGFPSFVLTDMDEHAIEMYQCGIKFYQKINNMMLEHAQMYLIMLRDEYVWDFLGDMLDLYVGIYGEERVYEKYGIKYQDIGLSADEWIVFDMAEEYTNEFMNLIPKLNSKQNQIKVHPLSAANIVQAGIYAVYAIHCPVDVAITNNGTVVAEVTNDVITTLDETSGISIHLICTAENASASKFIMLPEGYELQILGNSTGTMSFEKAIIENGNVTTISTITDIPVQNGSAYTEVIEDGVTVALECDQENDGVADQILTAEVTNVVTLGDLNSDGEINASDAAMILVAAAAVGSGSDNVLTTIQESAADVNGDGAFDAVDAAIVLQYAAAVGSGYTGTLEEFLAA